MGLVTLLFRRKRKMVMMAFMLSYLVFAVIVLHPLIRDKTSDTGRRSGDLLDSELESRDIEEGLDQGFLKRQPALEAPDVVEYDDIQDSGAQHKDMMESRKVVYAKMSMAEIQQYREKRFEAYALSEPNRTGPGEQGIGITLRPEEEARGKEDMEEKGFHLFISDRISLQRSLPDVRPDECQAMSYPEDLPTISVIIIFCNEAPSTLLRTAHSVVNRTPPRYLREVILVDDTSDRENLKEELDDYVSKTWPDGVVWILRLKERHGLIRTRMAGIKAASGDAIAVFDAHVEVAKGWAEPILSMIKENPKTLVAPSLDYIDLKSFKYIAGNPYSELRMRWDMGYMWLGIPKERRRPPTTPIRSETIVGCAFAMHRENFLAMGGFDEGMNIWGGENIEIGLRVNLCGGQVVNLPCSHVAHLFRARKPWTVENHGVYSSNFRRLVEVWLDDYKRYYYEAHPTAKDVNYGDISERLALKQRLGCRNFDWFIHNLTHKFLHDEDTKAWGKIRDKNGRCVDMMGWEHDGKKIGSKKCSDGYSSTQSEEIFALTRRNYIRSEFFCFDYTALRPGSDVALKLCSETSESQLWKYNHENGSIVHLVTGLCLDQNGHPESPLLTVQECAGSASQQWTWDNVASQSR